MLTKTYSIVSLILTTMGVLFAGYLSFFRIFLNRCAFNEPCPYFLGLPACWYGLFMFGLMFLTSLLGNFKVLDAEIAKKIILGVSIVGIVFASRFAAPEIKLLISGQSHHYPLLLPTCTWGLVFYILIFIASVL